MDKGYDSEEIHELIRDTLNSCSLIPVRNRKRKRISGYYRRRLAHAFDEEKYHQRNKVETVFSVLKRKFGEALKARIYRLQIKEIKIKVILYNLSRMITTLSFLVLIEEFYRACILLFYYIVLKKMSLQYRRYIHRSVSVFRSSAEALFCFPFLVCNLLIFPT
jgi:hypothetical protein